MQIRIVDTPPGEAPVAIRNAWIGIVLPLVPGVVGPQPALVSGVLSGPRGALSALLRLITGRIKRATVYPVRARVAFDLLERHAPDAAAWWRSHTPHLYDDDRVLGFHSHGCELVDDDGHTIGSALPNQPLQTDGASRRR
jgi:hypothetical protein